MLAHTKSRYQDIKILSFGLSLVMAADKSYLAFFSAVTYLEIGEFGTETPKLANLGSRRTKTIFAQLCA